MKPIVCILWLLALPLVLGVAQMTIRSMSYLLSLSTVRPILTSPPVVLCVVLSALLLLFSIFGGTFGWYVRFGSAILSLLLMLIASFLCVQAITVHLIPILHEVIERAHRERPGSLGALEDIIARLDKLYREHPEILKSVESVNDRK